MYRYLIYFAILILLCGYTQKEEKQPADYVNPFIGAITSGGNGKTIPGACTPFGLVQLSPNTITGQDNGNGYSYGQ